MMCVNPLCIKLWHMFALFPAFCSVTQRLMRTWVSGFESQLSFFPEVWLWAFSLSTLNLYFLIWKMRITFAPISWRSSEDSHPESAQYRIGTQKMFSSSFVRKTLLLTNLSMWQLSIYFMFCGIALGLGFQRHNELIICPLKLLKSKGEGGIARIVGEHRSHKYMAGMGEKRVMYSQCLLASNPWVPFQKTDATK